MIAPEQIRPGMRIEVSLPGVPTWNVPPQTMTAAVTAENLAALRADVAEQIERGGATVREIEAAR